MSYRFSIGIFYLIINLLISVGYKISHPPFKNIFCLEGRAVKNVHLLSSCELCNMRGGIHFLNIDGTNEVKIQVGTLKNSLLKKLLDTYASRY